MHSIKITLSLLLLLLFSCEKELVIDNKYSEHKLVVNSIFNSNSPFEVEITSTFSPYKEIEVQEIKEATVSIYEEDVLKEILNYQASTDKHLGKYRSSFIPDLSKNYQIKVSANGYDEVEAKGKIPTIVPFRAARATNNNIWPSNGPGLSRYDFSFILDDKPEENYYYLTISSPINKQNEQTLEWEPYAHQYAEVLISDLPNTKLYINNGVIFTDKSFNGSTFEVKGSATTYSDIYGDFDATYGLVKDSTLLEISLHHLSKEVYYFYTSHATNLLNQGDFYSEPSIIYSNIKNGLGIFGGEAIERQEVVVE